MRLALALVLVFALCRSANAESCITSLDCTAVQASTCAFGTCAPGPACSSDDPSDAGDGDDGPASSRRVALTVGAPTIVDGSLCAIVASSSHGEEADWITVSVLQGEGLEVTLENVDAYVTVIGPDHLTYANNRPGGSATVVLTYLPAGDYFVRLVMSSGLGASLPYRLTLLRTPPRACRSATDCAAEHDTQLYRGDCHGGACRFLPSVNDLGAPCDAHAPPSCNCTYQPYGANAEGSTCRFFGSACFAGGLCGGPRSWGVCRGGGAPPDDPFCHMCPPAPIVCSPCSYDLDCGVGWACGDDGLCVDLGIDPEDPTPPDRRSFPPGESGSGCDGGAGGSGGAMLALAMIALRRRCR